MTDTEKVALVGGLLAAYGDREDPTPVDYEFLVSQLWGVVNGEA